MGKKEAQRTKGNTKAASSARSAQILGENVGFVGFGTAAEAGFVPLLQAGLRIPVSVSGLDPDSIGSVEWIRIRNPYPDPGGQNDPQKL
jgi:hypothetical protein